MSRAGTVIVTGASSGFGELIADLMAKQGHQVYGTSRAQQPDKPSGVKMRVLDMTSKDAVRHCIEGIYEETGKIDILINNAGISHLSLAEEMALEDIDQMIATNLLGPIYTTLAVLPFMRKHGGGRIVTLTSICGIAGFPAYASYSGSKFGIEGFMEALQYEVEPLNIHISLVEPATFKTGISMRQIGSVRRIPAYDGVRETIIKYMKADLANGKDPYIVASRVIQIAESNKTRLRYRVGSNSQLAFYLRKALPYGLFHQVFKFMMKLSV
jgi:NAD(P)-dependent dehydrogenase (short-subunit alcohol dehydrogenase family)